MTLKAQKTLDPINFICFGKPDYIHCVSQRIQLNRILNQF